MLNFLKSLIIGLWLAITGRKQAEGMALGKAEADNATMQHALEAAEREKQASVNAPTNKEQLIDQIRSGKVILALVILPLLTSCASNVTYVDCSAYRTWTPSELYNLAASLDFVPPDSPIITMGDEWAGLRAQAKACGE